MRYVIFLTIFISGCASTIRGPENWNPVDINETKALLEYSAASENFCLSMRDATEECKNEQIRYAGAIFEWAPKKEVANCLPYKVSSSKSSCRSKVFGRALEHCHEINKVPDHKAYDFKNVFSCINKIITSAEETPSSK